MYTYNWASELTNRLSDHMTKMVEWHNARSHLLSCIVSQKLGLFQHLDLCGYPLDPITKVRKRYYVTPLDPITKVRVILCDS